MTLTSLGRPISCLKHVFRRTRYQRMISRRCLATAAPSTKNASSSRQRAELEKLAKFEIWPQIPSIRWTHPDPMPALCRQQIAQLDPTGARTRMFSKEHADSAKPGDVLMVTAKNGEPFAGVMLQIRRRGVDTAIQLRGQSMKTGVELWFKIYSPTTTAINIIWRRPKRAKRARLTYMRKPQHDMGSVDKMVFAWKKEIYALRSKTKQGGSQKGTAKKI